MDFPQDFEQMFKQRQRAELFEPANQQALDLGLIYGSTGSGKATMLTTMLASLPKAYARGLVKLDTGVACGDTWCFNWRTGGHYGCGS
jgi:Tfp pilus assembly pilus retraction ATPase PilT